MENTRDRGHVSDTYKGSSLPSASYAPWYDVPSRSFISVEHPFIIKDIERGINSLGGPDNLEEVGSSLQFLQSDPDSILVGSRKR